MNFQNIPRDLKVVKQAFVPKRGAFSFFDYKAIEPRLTAYFAAKMGMPQFAEAISAGIDPYTAVARLVTGKDSITEDERQTWKVAYLSLLYGGGTKTIQLQFDVNQPTARKMIKQFHDNWPAVRRLQDSVQEVARRRGYIVTPWGRHLHMEEFGEHKLLNKLVQGSAADMMKAALLRVDRWTRISPVESRMVSVIHDEIIIDGPEDEVELLNEVIPDLMALEPWLTEVVPILVDHEVSTTTWADKEPYDSWKERGGSTEVRGQGLRRAEAVR